MYQQISDHLCPTETTFSEGFYFASIARVRFCRCQYLRQILQIAARHLSQRIHLPMPNIKLIPFHMKKLKGAKKCAFYLHSPKKYTTFAPHSVKGSRWESCTVPLLWFAIRCSNSYKSLVLSELGRLNKRSDKSEDLLRATNEELVKLNALGESSQRQWRKGFQYYLWYACTRIGIW